MGILNLDYKLGLLIKGLQKALMGKIDPDCPDCEVGEESGSGEPNSSGSGDESGSGDIFPSKNTRQTLSNRCENSVNEDCIDDAPTTKGTQDADNNIHIYEPIFDSEPKAGSSIRSSAKNIIINLVLILLGLTATGIL